MYLINRHFILFSSLQSFSHASCVGTLLCLITVPGAAVELLLVGVVCGTCRLRREFEMSEIKDKFD